MRLPQVKMENGPEFLTFVQYDISPVTWRSASDFTLAGSRNKLHSAQFQSFLKSLQSGVVTTRALAGFPPVRSVFPQLSSSLPSLRSLLPLPHLICHTLAPVRSSLLD